MKPAVTYPDVEHLVVDLLTDLLVDTEPDVTVGVGVPATWTPAADPHIQVACDGTPAGQHPIVAHPTVRVTAWASTPTRAKGLCHLAHGFLAAHPGGDGIAAIVPLTGMFPGRDPDSRADIASCTLRVSVRSVPI